MTTPRPDGAAGTLDRVLVMAPYRKDADYLAALLIEHSIAVDVAGGVTELAEHLAALAGILVITHESLTPDVIAAVADALERQPPWSEMPVIVLLDRAAPNARIRNELAKLWPRSRQLFYERPVKAVELLSGIQAALLVRLRQRDVRDHIEREIELRRELNHRVKNILASVNSIFMMTRRGAVSVEQMVEDFQGRLDALSEVHTAVFQAEDESVSMDSVAVTTLAPYRDADGRRVRIEGPPVMLSREAGTTITLCLHELTTNAVKYGALSCPDRGGVTLRWALTDGDAPTFRLEWRESGGPAVAEPERRGYGTRYIRAALTSLFGRAPDIAFHAEGLSLTVSGPLARLQPVPASTR